MAVLNNSALVGASGKGGTGAITTPQRSLRFNSADASHLYRLPGTAGNRRTFTLSWWMKRSGLFAFQSLFNSWTDANNRFAINFDSSIGAGSPGDYLTMFNGSGGVWNNIFQTNAVFRDPSAWYHCCIAVDTTQAVGTDRVKLWVNNVAQTFSSYTAPGPSAELNWNSATAHYFGVYGGGTANTTLAFNGYLAFVHHIDSQALTPSAFAYTDPVTGRWEPKAYAGSYSGNSFYLDFSDNSAATATALGADRSGLGNNWVPNNIVAAPTIAYSNYVTNQYSLYNYTGSTNLDPTAAKYLFDGGTSVAVIDWNGVYNATQSPPYRLEFIPPTPISFTSQVRVYSVAGPQSPYNNRITVDLGSGYGSPISVIQNNWVTVATGAGQLHKLKATADQNGTSMSAIEIDGVILTQVSGAAVDSLRDHPVSAGIDGGLGGEVSGNYCTLNPLDNPSGVVLTNGNLDHSYPSAAFKSVRGTQMMSSGKWYYEMVHQVAGAMLGIARPSDSISSHLGAVTNAGIGLSNGVVYKDGASIGTGVSLNLGDVLGCAFDASAGKLWFSVNGTWVNSGNPAAGTNPIVSSLTDGTWMPAVTSYNTGSSYNSINFGQRPWAYPGSVPAGFKALCDQNLPAPLIARPSTAMDVVTYVGDGGSTRTISGLQFSPDLVWTKSRNQGYGQNWFDTVRGAGNVLRSDIQNPELSNSSEGYLSSFNVDGYTMSAGSNTSKNGNELNTTYVGWAWDAGGQPTTDNVAGAGNVPTAGSVKINGANMTTALAGTIPATRLSANTAAGFSVVTWTGNGSTSTIAHGGLVNLDKGMIIVKTRTGASVSNWMVGHGALGWTKVLEGLNTTSAAATDSASWDNTAPTSTVFTAGGGQSNINGSGRTFAAFCFAPVAGYSSAFSFTGNGSSDGPFCFLGFRPRFLIIKRTDAAYGWYMYDTARDTYNIAGKELLANASDAEVSDSDLDILSNGFKPRRSSLAFNASGGTFIGFAWAESPFQYARAR